MANVLIFADRPPIDPTHGGHLRVINLASELAKTHSCSLASFGDTEAKDLANLTSIFRHIQLLPSPSGYAPSVRRYFRLSNATEWRLSRPEYYSVIVDKLQAAVRNLNIDVLFAASLNLAEFCTPILKVKKVLDDYDCATLGMEREYRIRKHEMTLGQRIKFLVHLARTISHESRLTRTFDLITTISLPDLRRLKRLNRFGNQKIVVVPNGVSSQFLTEKPPAKERISAIAFWGSLDFIPNLTAVKYFYENVFREYLADKDVKWFIIGKTPGKELHSLAEAHKNIIVTGHVEDLRGLAEQIPIMVNPMIMGSGLKNKVLEAFAMKRAVVSTRLGMEAIAAHDGKEFILADTPHQFAQAILTLLGRPSEAKLLGERARDLVLKRYTWDRVGTEFNLYLKSVLDCTPPLRHGLRQLARET